MVIQTIVLIDELLQCDLFGMLVISAFYFFTIVLLILTKSGRFYLGGLLFNTVFSFGLIFLTIIYNGAEEIAFVYLILIYTSLLFSKNDAMRIILVLFNVLAYFLVRYAEINIDSILKRELDLTSNISLFIAAASAIAFMTFFLIRELIFNENEINKLINSLKVKNEKLKMSNDELERFTYLASHDLKAPLRTIISFIGLAENKIKNDDRENIDEYFDIIKGGAIQMNSLIQDSLEYSKANQENAIYSDTVDLSKLIKKVQTNIESEYGSFELITDDLPTIVSKESLLFKVLLNVISNGVKYNESAPPQIKVNHQIQGDQLRLTIMDNGIGIDKRYYEDIFIIYKRLHSQSEYTGTGLGLAICKKICEQMGGDITVSSALGVGSTFTISVSVKKSNG